MKKSILIIGGVLILSVILITSISLSNKQEALNYLRNYKQTNNTGSITITSIKITSDKICHINYENEYVYCEVCFEYKYSINNQINRGCVDVTEDSTKKEDNKAINDFINREKSRMIPQIDVSFIKESRKGDVVSTK